METSKHLRRAFISGVMLSGLLALMSSCKPAGGGASGGAAAKPADGAPKSYLLTGEVLKVDAERKALLVQHDEIKGFMPAMTMEFTVSAGDIANAKVGGRIRGELFELPGGEYRLERIWPVDSAADATIANAAGSLRQDTSIRGKRAYREVGENLPDFALYDQEGKVVSAARFRGKQVMMNFIFTRCPIATMCPAATANMTATQQKAKEAGVGNIEFVSITLDPEYDTPGVLKEYAQLRGIDTANFSFLTGPETAIKDLLTQFGIIAEFDGSILKHTLATLLIDAEGRIVWRADGSQWTPKEFVAKMRKS